MEAKPRRAEFFTNDDGSEPVRDWLKSLKRKNRHVEHGKITARISRAEEGNFGEHRFLGGSWGELKIDFGPGYRVYFGIYCDELILLLHGGTKQNQQEDINLAEERWQKYLGSKEEKIDDK